MSGIREPHQNSRDTIKVRGITFASRLAGRNETWSLKTSGGSGTKESVKKNGRRPCPSRPASLLFSGFLHFSLAHSSREGNYGKNPSEDERDEEKRRGERGPALCRRRRV